MPKDRNSPQHGKSKYNLRNRKKEDEKMKVKGGKKDRNGPPSKGDQEFDQEEYSKLLASLFPSRYADAKAQHHEKSRKSKKSKKSKREESEEESEEEEIRQRKMKQKMKRKM